MLFFHDQLSFKRLINSFVERAIIRRNKSNKAIDVSCSSDCKIAQKQCSESSKSKSELIECIKSTWDNPDISGTSDGGKSYFYMNELKCYFSMMNLVSKD